MIKLPYHTLFLVTLFSFSTVYAQQELQFIPDQDIEKQIIEGRDIELFDMILEGIITSKRFQERFQTIPPLTQEQWKAKWKKILRDDIPLLDEIRKQDLVEIIKDKGLFSLEDVLDNNVGRLEVEILFNTFVRGKIVHDDESPDEIQLIEEQTIEEALIDRAIMLIEKAEKINEDMKELKGAFEELNEIVEQQGEEIDQIEESVKDAKQEVKRGVQNIEKAEKYQKNSRQIYYILLVILILITLLGILFFRRRK